MRCTIILLLAIVSTAVLAADPHWIELKKFPAFNGGTATASLDDSTMLAHESFKGFYIKTDFENIVVSSDGLKLVSIIETFEYNCQTREGRAKPVLVVDTDGVNHYIKNGEWRPITTAPATDILAQVRLRVCFYALPGTF